MAAGDAVRGVLRRAALILARMGRLVKVMPGGITGWADEQLPFA